MNQSIRALALAAGLLVATAASAVAVSEKKAQQLWEPIGAVLASPRCSNCHSSTEFPRQLDTRDRHQQMVVRGSDDNGAATLKCATCHQTTNSGDNGMVPGSAGWHMPPVAMGWDGLSSAQLCKAITTPATNGNRKTPKLIVNHMLVDPVVLWAWKPGGERTLPPMSYALFSQALRAWEKAGVPCPTQ